MTPSSTRTRSRRSGLSPANFTELGVDFLTSGSYKWLLASFGVAPFFIREEHLDRIRPDRCGHAQITERLSGHRFRLHPSALKYEYASLAFGPVAQLATALDYLNQVGLSRIETHHHGARPVSCERDSPNRDSRS